MITPSDEAPPVPVEGFAAMLVSIVSSAGGAAQPLMLTILLYQIGPGLAASFGYNIEWVPGARAKQRVIQ